MATATSRPPARDTRDIVNPPRGFDQSAMLTSYRVWDYILIQGPCDKHWQHLTQGWDYWRPWLNSADNHISCMFFSNHTGMDVNDSLSTFVQVMAWGHLPIDHYLSYCWSVSMMSYGITRGNEFNPQISEYINSSCRQNTSNILFFLHHITRPKMTIKIICSKRLIHIL